MSRDMASNNEKLIAVIGATGQQGGAVVRALQSGGQFKVRALTYDQIALANKIAGGPPSEFATWARVNFPVSSDRLLDRIA